MWDCAIGPASNPVSSTASPPLAFASRSVTAALARSSVTESPSSGKRATAPLTVSGRSLLSPKRSRTDASDDRMPSASSSRLPTAPPSTAIRNSSGP